jgi:hypothetical protein
MWFGGKLQAEKGVYIANVDVVWRSRAIDGVQEGASCLDGSGWRFWSGHKRDLDTRAGGGGDLSNWVH